MDALGEALARIEPARTQTRIAALTYQLTCQRILASAGIRDEHVFPTPIILEMKPTLLGYYRLLLGVPQKSFLSSPNTGISRIQEQWKARGVLNERQKAMLPLLCRALGGGLAELVRQMSPVITQRATWPSCNFLLLEHSFREATTTQSESRPSLDAFLSVREIVKDHVVDEQQGRDYCKEFSGPEGGPCACC